VTKVYWMLLRDRNHERSILPSRAGNMRNRDRENERAYILRNTNLLDKPVRSTGYWMHF